MKGSEKMTLIQGIVGNLTGALVDFAKGFGKGLVELVNQIFLTSDGQLNTFGVLITIFAGVSLAFGLSRWVLNWVASLGQRNR